METLDENRFSIGNFYKNLAGRELLNGFFLYSGFLYNQVCFLYLFLAQNYYIYLIYKVL